MNVIGSFQVLLYDPLYQWSMSPLKAMHLQRRQVEESTSFFDGGGGGETGNNATTSGVAGGREGDSTNKMAERVLIRLQEKLEGIEEGVPLSISGQVNHLIQEATDPANLCRLFPGWQPWI
jgi:ataxia telangiectasia mutated family protein